MEHLTYEDIEEKYPEEYAAREASKLTYRYPSGESYQVLRSILNNLNFSHLIFVVRIWSQDSSQ